MRKAKLLFLAAVIACGTLAFTSGCSSSPAVEETPEDPVMAGPESPTGSRWGQYLVVMTDLERERFMEIDGEFERNQWLRREGIDVRAELNHFLERGLNVDTVHRRLRQTPDEVMQDADTTTMFFSRYNTQSRTEFWLKFEGDSLIAWNSYTMEQQARERELLDFQQQLMRRFNTVLRRGMGMNEINRNAAGAQADLNRVERAHHERTTNPDYRGTRSVSTRDYIIAEQLLYARSRNEMFEWFHGRTPNERIIQRPFETHRYHMTHTDLRGNETLILVDFVFEDGLLANWFIYHER
jgi:hypothetical protein